VKVEREGGGRRRRGKMEEKGEKEKWSERGRR